MRKSAPSFPSLVSHSITELQKIRDNFFNELVKASSGEKSTLGFIKNPIPKSYLAKDALVQVMTVGGSVFTSAKAALKGKTVKIFELKKKPLPIFKTALNLFEFLDKNLSPKVNHIVINFAYPLKPEVDKNMDGYLLSGTKENAFIGLVGKKVGKEYENYLLHKNRKVKISVVNDVISLVLAVPKKTDLKTIISGIVGSGTNFAIFLDNKTAVNLESGNFSDFPLSEETKKIDRESVNPGAQLFEKEVSGQYLYKHYNLMSKKYFGYSKPISNTFELNQIAQQSEENRKEFVFLARNILERSASLIACQIGGIYLFKKQILDEKLEMLNIVMEGSLFWQGWHYQTLVKNYLVKLNVPKKIINFNKITNSNLIGAAKLVLREPNFAF